MEFFYYQNKEKPKLSRSLSRKIFALGSKNRKTDQFVHPVGGKIPVQSGKENNPKDISRGIFL